MEKIIELMNKEQLECLKQYESNKKPSYLLKVLECGPADAQTKYGDTVLHLFMKNYYYINSRFGYFEDLIDFLIKIQSHNINPFIKNHEGLTASGITRDDKIPARIYQSLHAYETAYKVEQDAIALAALGRLIQEYTIKLQLQTR